MAFYSWIRTDELINVKRKASELNIESNDKKGCFYHKGTMFRRKNYKKKSKRKHRTHGVHKLSEIEKGCCMEFFLDMWLVQLSKVKVHPLRGDDYLFPTLTKGEN